MKPAGQDRVGEDCVEWQRRPSLKYVRDWEKSSKGCFGEKSIKEDSPDRNGRKKKKRGPLEMAYSVENFLSLKRNAVQTLFEEKGLGGTTAEGHY